MVASTLCLIEKENTAVDQPHSRVSINSLPVELLTMVLKGVYAAHRSGKPTSMFDSESESDSSSDSGSDSDSDSTSESCDAPSGRWIPADPLSPSYFPLALAQVCKTWRDVMASVPEFWTRLVIFVDDEPTPLDVVESWLEWSGDLPLEILVTRRLDRFKGDDPEEGERVEGVLDLLYDHIERCKRLCFDVLLSSSLPLLRCDFADIKAPNLEVLSLECRVDNGPHSVLIANQILASIEGAINTPSDVPLSLEAKTSFPLDDISNTEQSPLPSREPPNAVEAAVDRDDDESEGSVSSSGDDEWDEDESGSWADSTDWEFKAPKLDSLVMDGRNFCDAFLDGSEAFGWEQHLPIQSLQSFHISHYKPREGEIRLAVYDLLAVLAEEAYHLSSLTIEDVDFQGWRLTELFYIRQKFLADLKIVDLSELAVSEVLRSSVFSLETIHVVRCPINNLRLIPDQCSTEALYFEEIDADQDFRIPLRNWDGRALIFDNCPGFNDNFLAQMGKGTPWLCKDLVELHINDCPNFTVRALKKMMKKRRDRAAQDGEWGDGEIINWREFPTVRPITTLRVYGGPPLSNKDKAWFSDIMKSGSTFFSWTPSKSKDRQLIF